MQPIVLTIIGMSKRVIETLPQAQSRNNAQTIDATKRDLGDRNVKKKRDEILRRETLEYHEKEPRGKIKVVPTKPHATAHELSLAYSPGVAFPCLEIAERPEDAYRYTSKGNLVAVISN